ncbi:unnamed protein product [Rhizoctonia solani]|uniref:Peptidase C14 caspase domain-containing protein n=1 Tax=Rhizoctonia solani TaxID=456999 RepID=A0A8H2XB93_9AGAM|nr:unnamed protein product [Rhizoctonia solani]
MSFHVRGALVSPWSAKSSPLPQTLKFTLRLLALYLPASGVVMHEEMWSSPNMSLPSDGSSRPIGIIDNGPAHHAKRLYALEREEHILRYLNEVLVLVVSLVVLHHYWRRTRRERRVVVSTITLTIEPDSQLECVFLVRRVFLVLTIIYIHSKDPLGLTREMSLLKALGGRDLLQRIERVSSHPSPNTSTYVPLNDSLRYLKAPKAKGHSEPAPQAHVPQGNHKALVIGLNGPIAHKDRSLNYAVRDARRFEKCLQKLNTLDQSADSQLSGRFNFSIEVLTDEDGECVPRARVFKALDALFKGAKSGDLLVLFFSGHCYRMNLGEIISLMTVESESKFLLVPSTVFSQYISKLPPGCTVEVFLDCCYGSGLIQLDNVIREMTSGSVPPGSGDSCLSFSMTGVGGTSDAASTRAPFSAASSGKHIAHIAHAKVPELQQVHQIHLIAQLRRQ